MGKRLLDQDVLAGSKRCQCQFIMGVNRGRNRNGINPSVLKQITKAGCNRDIGVAATHQC